MVGAVSLRDPGGGADDRAPIEHQHQQQSPLLRPTQLERPPILYRLKRTEKPELHAGLRTLPGATVPPRNAGDLPISNRLQPPLHRQPGPCAPIRSHRVIGNPGGLQCARTTPYNDPRPRPRPRPRARRRRTRHRVRRLDRRRPVGLWAHRAGRPDPPRLHPPHLRLGRRRDQRRRRRRADGRRHAPSWGSPAPPRRSLILVHCGDLTTRVSGQREGRSGGSGASAGRSPACSVDRVERRCSRWASTLPRRLSRSAISASRPWSEGW